MLTDTYFINSSSFSIAAFNPIGIPPKAAVAGSFAEFCKSFLSHCVPSIPRRMSFKFEREAWWTRRRSAVKTKKIIHILNVSLILISIINVKTR